MNLEKIYLFLLFVIVLMINLNSLNLPYYWDDFNYVIPAINHVYNDNPTIFLWEQGLGHPPFLFILGGLTFKLFGDSPMVAHSIILIFSFLAVLFTYLLGKELFSRKTGIIASLLLSFTPIFVSYSSLVYLEMPLTALVIMSVYFAVKNKPWPSIIFGSLAVLTKEIGILAVLGIFLAKFIKHRKAKTLIYGTPILVFLLLITLNKIHYGDFIFPASSSLINIFPIKNLVIIMAILKSLFFDQFRWVLSSLIIISLVSKDLFKKPKKQIIFASILSLILLLMIFSLSFLNLENYFQNINTYLSLLKKFSVIIITMFFLLILNLKEFFNTYIRRELYELYFPALLIIGTHFLIIPFPPRYILPAYPLVFILFGFSVNKFFKRYAYLFTFLFIILSISLFTGERSGVGFTLEENLEYRDFIEVRQNAADFISKNYPDSTVLVSYPMSMDLKHTYGKYVDDEINVVTVSPFGYLTIKNYTEFLSLKNSNKEEINLDEINLYYYSPQEFPIKNIYDARDKLNLTLIKKFEKNNKVTEIYLVN